MILTDNIKEKIQAEYNIWKDLLWNGRDKKSR